MKIAALYVETGGVYSSLPDIDVWDVERDARKYKGPHRVIAHPPCQRWGKYWHGSPSNPHQYRRGEDEGCFASALTSVRNYGGCLEHPAYSSAWRYFGIPTPLREDIRQWGPSDLYGGRTCYLDQGKFGHPSRKPTWIYAVGVDFAGFTWTELGEQSGQKLEQLGKRKRLRTPVYFRDELIRLVGTQSTLRP